MPCERFATALTDHAAGAALDARLAAHLAACARCRLVLQTRRDLFGDIDRDLRAAIALEPSPGFGAQVRARIAIEPEEHARWPRHAVLAAAASVAVALGALLLVPALRHGNPLPARSGAPVVAQPAAPPHVDAPRAEARHARIARPARVEPSRSGGGLRRATRTASPEPEILVPPAHAEAIRRLVREVAEGRLDIQPDALPLRAGRVAPLVVAPIAVAPIKIAPAGRVRPAEPLTKGVES